MSKLKLYTCRVVYQDPTAKNSYFTMLDVSKSGVDVTCSARAKILHPINFQTGGIKIIEITEIKGPFEAGQILHEER